MHHQRARQAARLAHFSARDTLDAVRETTETSASALRSSAQSGTRFECTVRVYYEDTDAGGVVYYANYLKFFERCRTEWLRALGIDQAALAREQGLQFVVTEIETKYLRPARLDDELAVEARVVELGRCSIVFGQSASRAGELLAQARVKVACVDSQRRVPARLPQGLRERVRPWPPHPQAADRS
jgi:acyl-CoA thioester hydrolase